MTLYIREEHLRLIHLYIEMTCMHSRRIQAFSNDEIEQTKDTADAMKEYQLKLDDVWKSVRWATDIITYAREKTNLGKSIFSFSYLFTGLSLFLEF